MFESQMISRRAALLGLAGLSLPRAMTAASNDHDHGAMEPGPMNPMPKQTGTQEPDAGRLGNPRLAGQPRARTTEWDNDPFVVELEHRLKCNCGCAHSLYACRTTDFSCQFWQPLHAEVIEMVKQEMTAEEIIDAYVTKYGTQYLMAPPAEGFNVAGYIVPGILISVVAAGMAWLLQRRTRLSAAPVTADAGASTPSLNEADEAKLAEELNKFQS